MRAPLTLVLSAGAVIAVLAGPGRAADYDDLVMRGAWEYHDACAVCHGSEGTGDGAMGASLKVAPPDLTGLSARNSGVFPFEYVFRVIDGRNPIESHGSGEMPVWGRAFLREALDGEPGTSELNLIVAGRVYALAQYLQAIQGGRKIPLVEQSRPRRSWPGDIPVWPGRP